MSYKTEKILEDRQKHEEFSAREIEHLEKNYIDEHEWGELILDKRRADAEEREKDLKAGWEPKYD